MTFFPTHTHTRGGGVHFLLGCAFFAFIGIGCITHRYPCVTLWFEQVTLPLNVIFIIGAIILNGANTKPNL
jgi:hypothetical protein